MDVYVKLQRYNTCVVLAICDVDILGKTLKQGEITFCVQEKFYKGSLVAIEEAIDLIEQSTIVNMVGQRIVKEAIARGLIHPDATVEIEGIPHAQIVKL